MLDLFKIGFFTVSLLDLLDIFLVSFLIYKLYTVIRGTIAAQIFIGLIIVLLLSFISQAANLKAFSWILKLITDIWVIAFIILFQPEIRRLLLMLGRNPFGRVFMRSDEQSVVDIITEASFEMAQHQHGALIVIIKSVGLKGIAESGEMLNAKVGKSLLRSIFFPRWPLHDGAAIIKGNIVEAVKCTLPLSQRTSINGEALGMRHRAGLGISEEADVVTVIVSEETGGISVAVGGELQRGLSKEALKNKLISSLGPSKDRNWRGIFEQFGKNK